MSAIMQEAVEMQRKDEETPKSDETQTAQNNEASSSSSAAEGSSSPASAVIEDFSSELKTPLWSIVTFEGVAMSGLDYEEALKWLKKLDEQKISGLCIVTDEAAARISK